MRLHSHPFSTLLAAVIVIAASIKPLHLTVSTLASRNSTSQQVSAGSLVNDDLVASTSHACPAGHPTLELTHASHPELATSGATLKSLAAKQGVRIGTAVQPALLSLDQPYGDVLAQQFDSLTPENALKFEVVHPAPDHFDFCAADAVFAAASQRGMAVRGHTLVWHNQLPSWLRQSDFSRDELINVLRNHITTVVGRYRGQVAAWDVVNEAFNDDGTLRETIWLRGIGPEYIEMAFRWAHEADPDAKLFYNDFGGEGLGAKSDAIFRMVRDLKRRAVPIHGVGLQMHVALEAESRPAIGDLKANMKRLASVGVETHITEMDVRVPLPVSATDLERQAAVYNAITAACLAESGCTSITLWGFTDRHSWVSDSGAFPGNGAALLFDEAYQPKPAFEALQNAFMGA